MVNQGCVEKCKKEQREFSLLYPSYPRYKLQSEYNRCITECEQMTPSPLEAKHKQVCEYLKSKIADEEKETRQYDKLERDAQILTNGHVFLDVLMDAQRTEVNELKKLYDDICKR